MKFLNRKNELSLLNQIHKKKSSQFVIMYGRRRIGKTTLLTYWLSRLKTKSIFWVSHRNSSEMLLEKFSKAISANLPQISTNIKFRDWETAFQQLFTISKKQKLIVVIDEFPYLLYSVPHISSLLQTVWDQNKHTGKIILIVCGSHYNMMHRQFISGKAPLYGRSTADILLQPIEPAYINSFLPRYSSEQIVETFSIIGGVPKYLEMWDDSKTVFKNIHDLILSPVTIFRQEAIYLIQDELQEPRTYIAILEALGNGLKSPNEISKRTGILINHVGKYIKVLYDLGFIRRVLSLTTKYRTNTRQSKYEIKDPYLKFYFHFIYSNLELIEQNRINHFMEIIKEKFISYVSVTGYEELARRFITNLGDDNKLSFKPDYIGRIWNKSHEIDIAASNTRDRIILLGECKWTKKKVTLDVLESLYKKARFLTKVKDYKKIFALFSKSGFTLSLQKKAEKENVMLFQGGDFTRIT